MLQVMKDIGGVELPETFIRMAGEDMPSLDGKSVVAEKPAESAVEEKVSAGATETEATAQSDSSPPESDRKPTPDQKKSPKKSS